MPTLSSNMSRSNAADQVVETSNRILISHCDGQRYRRRKMAAAPITNMDTAFAFEKGRRPSPREGHGLTVIQSRVPRATHLEGGRCQAGHDAGGTRVPTGSETDVAIADQLDLK